MSGCSESQSVDVGQRFFSGRDFHDLLRRLLRFGVCPSGGAAVAEPPA